MSEIVFNDDELSNFANLPNSHVLVDISKVITEKYVFVDYKCINQKVCGTIDFELTSEEDVVDALIDRYRKRVVFSEFNDQNQIDTLDDIIAMLKTSKRYINDLNEYTNNKGLN